MGTLIMVLIVSGLIVLGLRTWGSFAKQTAGSGDDRIPTPPKLLWLLPVAVVAIPALLTSYVTIDAGHVGVVTRFGAATGAVFQQGLNFKTPYIEEVVIFDVRTQKEQVEAAAASRDLQEVKSTIALNYHLDPSSAVVVFSEIGIEYKARIVDPAIQEAFKATTAQFTAEELITKREVVKLKARETIEKQLARFHVVVDELNITNFDFSKEFNAAIEAAQVAARKVVEAENKLRQIEVEAQQRVKQAQADKEAIELNAQGRANATKTEADAQAYAQEKLRPNLNDLYLQWLALQNQANAIKQWNGQLPTYNMGDATPFINLLAPKQ